MEMPWISARATLRLKKQTELGKHGAEAALAADKEKYLQGQEDSMNKLLLPGIIVGLRDISDAAEAQGLLAVTETREALDAAGLFNNPVNDMVWELAQIRREEAKAILRATPENSK